MTTIPEMIPNELHHAFGRALRIIHAFAKIDAKIDGEEIPACYLSDLADQLGEGDLETIYGDYPRDWSCVYPDGN